MGWVRKNNELINNRVRELYYQGLRPYIIARRLGLSTDSVLKRIQRMKAHEKPGCETNHAG